MKIASGYAEMFEWEDGNPNKEDRTGLTVALYNGDKIRVAKTNDVPIGVIGGDNTSVAAISNASPHEWHGKHLRDVAGRLLWEGQVMVEWIDKGYRHWYETDRIPDGIAVPDNATYYYELNGHKLQREILSEEYKQKHGTVPGYEPRWERQEWGIVVLVGRAVIREGCVCNPLWKRLKLQAGELGGQSVAEWLLR
jgi:hypothetical protein